MSTFPVHVPSELRIAVLAVREVLAACHDRSLEPGRQPDDTLMAIALTNLECRLAEFGLLPEESVVGEGPVAEVIGRISRNVDSDQARLFNLYRHGLNQEVVQALAARMADHVRDDILAGRLTVQSPNLSLPRPEAGNG
jgi:hypothetical protein